LKAVFTALDGRPCDWNVIFDASLSEGSVAHATAMKYRRDLLELATIGISSSYGSRLDEMDLSSLVYVWAATVGAFVEWWLNHPEQTAAEMSERSTRVLNSLQEP